MVRLVMTWNVNEQPPNETYNRGGLHNRDPVEFKGIGNIGQTFRVISQHLSGFHMHLSFNVISGFEQNNSNI